ncbi:MAG: hypothetical protein M3N56_13785 [Actinomycetota bacterium]|nr:hypothetical protein [Actinomycetota bacterium]
MSRCATAGRACPIIGARRPRPNSHARNDCSDPGPRGDEDELYRRHHRDLHRAVAHAVNAPRELVEDACQNAWAILLRAQPDRTSIFGWLYVVATREAFRLRDREHRHVHLEAMFPAGSWDAVIADAFSIDDIFEVHEALEVIASLPARQRADLTLLVAGFSYVEIAELTGGRTYTNVNKHLAKARARIRLERLRGTASPREQDAPQMDR